MILLKLNFLIFAFSGYQKLRFHQVEYLSLIVHLPVPCIEGMVEVEWLVHLAVQGSPGPLEGVVTGDGAVADLGQDTHASHESWMCILYL